MRRRRSAGGGHLDEAVRHKARDEAVLGERERVHRLRRAVAHCAPSGRAQEALKAVAEDTWYWLDKDRVREKNEIVEKLMELADVRCESVERGTVARVVEWMDRGARACNQD